jgi:predicted nucleic acid-binding protein
VIVDTYAWVELFSAGAGFAQVEEVLGADERCLTPDIVLAEVARKMERDGAELELIRSKLAVILETSTSIPVDARIALGVHRADQELRFRARARKLGDPGLSDAIILSSARVYDGKVLTGDRHFEGLPETEWIGEPS